MRSNFSVWPHVVALACAQTVCAQESLRISVLTLDATGRPRLEFATSTNRYYLLERGDTLTNIAQPVAAGLFAGTAGGLRDDAPAGRRAARLRRRRPRRLV